MQSQLFIELKYLDNILITEEYLLLNYSVILISNIMKMNIFKIDLNYVPLYLIEIDFFLFYEVY